MNVVLVLLSALALTTAFAFSDPGKGLQPGEKAPQFVAKDSKGKEINLEKMLKKGPVVVMFYRGFWCPFCNKQLQSMQDSLALITQKGASLVAITPEMDPNIEKTIGKTHATFPIVHDKGGKIMTDYKTIYAVSDDLDKKMKGYGVNLSENNGDAGNNLPVPAVYIIGKDGKIKWAYFNEDYKKRPTVNDILKNL